MSLAVLYFEFASTTTPEIGSPITTGAETVEAASEEKAIIRAYVHEVGWSTVDQYTKGSFTTTVSISGEFVLALSTRMISAT